MNNITRLFDFPYHQLEKYNLKDALVTKYEGQWIKTSTQEYLDKANAISRGLLRLGVNRNDKIAIISSNNRTEWHITDIGVLQTGAQTVPMYPTISAEDYEYILNHSESQYVFVSDIEVYQKLQSIKANVPLSEMFGYVTTLRTLSSGRATSTMEFSHYEETPSNISEAVIKKAKGNA